MSRIGQLLTICAAGLLASLSALAGETIESGLTLTPEQITWKPNPRVPGLWVANMVGSGKQPGPYVYRVKFPKGRVVQPHTHPDERTYTVLSGTWYIGWGTTYDESKMTALPAGSYYVEPAGAPHFVATPDGETVVQITGTGPTKVMYVDSANAPKK